MPGRYKLTRLYNSFPPIPRYVSYNIAVIINVSDYRLQNIGRLETLEYLVPGIASYRTVAYRMWLLSVLCAIKSKYSVIRLEQKYYIHLRYDARQALSASFGPSFIDPIITESVACRHVHSKL